MRGKINILLMELYDRYDYINQILNRDFLRMDYDDWEIEEMKEELKQLDATIKLLKED
jgi:hypothetical protein